MSDHMKLAAILDDMMSDSFDIYRHRPTEAQARQLSELELQVMELLTSDADPTVAELERLQQQFQALVDRVIRGQMN